MGSEQGSQSRYISQSEENFPVATLAEEEEEVLKKLKGKPEVQTEHAEGLLSKGLHKKKRFTK